MKAFISCVVSLLLLAIGVGASWYVWFRPKAAPIVAVQQAAAEVAKSTVESITGKKFVIEGLDRASDDLPRRSSGTAEPENGLFSDKERMESEAQARKPFEKKLAAIEAELATLGEESGAAEAWLSSSEAYEEPNRDRLQEVLRRRGELATRIAKLEEDWLWNQAAMDAAVQAAEKS